MQPEQNELLQLVPPEPDPSGDTYGTKTYLAKWVDEQISTRLGGEPLYYQWVASSFNPLGNPPASNPSVLYLELDRAVQLGDTEHQKVKSTRAALMQQAYVRLSDNHEDLEELLKKAIVSAHIGLFKPQVWRVHANVTEKLTASPDEGIEAWHTDDFVLRMGEDFDVVIE